MAEGGRVKSWPPAFQWYPGDHDADIRTQLMDLEQEGAYRRLLDALWKNSGRLPLDFRILGAVAKNTPAEVMEHKLWPAMAKCFEVHENGTETPEIGNKRLDEVRKKQLGYKARQAEYGRKGSDKRWGKK